MIEVSEAVKKLSEQYELIPVCPEVLGGLEVPREACEIKGMSGSDVIDGDTIVLGGDKGTDCSGAFIIGGAKKRHSNSQDKIT